MKMKYFSACFLAIAAIFLTGDAASAQTQGQVPAPKETRSVEPPFVLNPKINPDSLFYQLAANQPVEDKSFVTWQLQTLGFRDLRMVVFMTDADRTVRVGSTILRVSLIVRDGDKEFEYFKKEVAIETGPGKTSGDLIVLPVYTDAVTIKIEPRNTKGNVHLSAYLLK